MEGSSIAERAYENELLAVFQRCDKEGQGLLDSEGLTQLCQMLHLEDNTESLISKLSTSDGDGISFPSFKNALLSLLASQQGIDRTHSPEREVSPKFVYGQKKYGRRSRPESTDFDINICEIEQIDEGDNDAFQTNDHSSINSDGVCTDRNVKENSFETEEITNGIISPDFSTPEKDIEKGCSELRMVWNRMSNNGYLNKTQLAMVCSSVGMDTLADQVVLQVFSKLGREPDGLISLDEFLELVRSWSPPSSPPPIPLSPPPPSSYEPEQIKYKSNCDVDMWDPAGLSSSKLFQELQTARNLLEALTEERDKLKTDLADANQRASLLAQEVDEHHTRIERASQSKMKKLDLKHAEEMKELEKRFQLEKEQMGNVNQKLETTVAKYVDQIGFLNSEISTLKQDFESLEKENKNLREKLQESESGKHELEKQLECFESFDQKIFELESADESIEKLKHKVTALQNENTELRDKNDELSIQLESATSRSCHRREGSWGCLDLNSVGGGGTKRRGKSPDWAESRPHHRMGKVRRCSTEADLSSTTAGIPLSQSIHNAHFKKGETSESGLETDVETVTGSSPTLSHASLENGGDYHENEVDKLKMYITELEHELDKYQMKEWEFSKVHFSDDESPQFPSMITLKSEQTPVTSQSLSNASDAMSYKSLGLNGDIAKENSVHPVENDTKTRIQRVLKEGCEGCRGVREILFADLVECSPNFNDGVEWDSTESVEPPRLNFQPFQPVSKFNFQIQNQSLDCSDRARLPEQTFNSLNLANSDKCFSCSRSETKESNGDEGEGSEVDRLKGENKTLAERCKEFENSLELLRLEYERTEDYWSGKLEEERRLYEEEQLQNDEKYAALELKIKEYADLFAAENKKSALPTIEEKDYLEKQFTDLEEEYEQFRSNAEEEFLKRDSKITSLESRILELQAQKIDCKDIEIQTEKMTSSSSEDEFSDSDELNSSKSSDVCKCQKGLTLEIRRKKGLKNRLLVECQALELHKRQLLDQISALRTSSQIHSQISNVQMWNALNSKLRYQESICLALENSLKQQQKKTEQALHKAYERHKFDLMNVQNTLKITREKLQKQSAITRQQLERLAAADSLVKDLFIENAQLVAEISSLHNQGASDRIGPISI